MGSPKVNKLIKAKKMSKDSKTKTTFAATTEDYYLNGIWVDWFLQLSITLKEVTAVRTGVNTAPMVLKNDTTLRKSFGQPYRTARFI